MNRTNNSDCPDQQTLLQFIQGRLDPPKLTDCESHLSDCEACHETLRGLDTNDTLSQHVSDALQNAKPVENISDTQAIDGLMQRLLQPNASRSSSIKKSSADAEIMADRAAEVLRCIEPPTIGDESLGRLGDYELLRLIGAGGTGVVFMAKDRTLDRMVALKVLRPSLGALARDRFIAEAKLAASIEHDNIVTIYQIGQQDRLAFIAMQWLPGETLEARLIRESGPLHENTIREFVAQIASGLSAAHARQLIHRDIKPANIWICEEDDRIKILDFGLARVTDEDSSFTQTGMLAGTLNFMSPEQARGLELDSRSDLFSLGCVMYQMLTGKLPFSAPTILATLQTIQSESPQPPIAANADCDADLSDLTMSLLEKLPGNRLASAQILVTCLQHERSRWTQSVATLSGKAPAVDITPKPSTSSVRSPSTGLRWLAAGLVGLVSIASWLMAPQIFRIATNQGELVIKTEDPNIKVEVRENGDLVRVLDVSSDESFDIQSGNYVFSATKKGSDTEFAVTPKSVKMTRGAKELVSVTVHKAQQNQADRVPKAMNEPAGRVPLPTDSKDLASILNMALLFQNKKLDRLRDQYRDSHPEVVHARKRLALISEQYHAVAQSDASAPKVASERSNRQIASTDSQVSLSPSAKNQPIYAGQNFDQWLRIAKTDREPKTVADAIAACGVLAEGEQKERFVALLRHLARQHGRAASTQTTNGGQANTENIYFTGLIKAINQLEPIEVSNFIQYEIESGNENSLGFCNGIFREANFNGDRDKRKEFTNRLLNLTPLLKRIRDKKVRLDWNLQPFFSECFRQGKTEVDLELCKDTIRTLDVDQRPWVYRTFTEKFDAGELDSMIESDFLADSTDGVTREAFIHSLKTSGYALNFGGSGFHTAPVVIPRKHVLLNRLLMESIVRTLDEDTPKLKFKTYQYIYYTDDRVVTTSEGQNGEMYWQSVDQGLTRTKPEGTVKAQGTSAIVRNLISELCQVVSAAEPLQEDERDEIVTFIKKLNSSNKAYKDLATMTEFENLKIHEDLTALLKIVKGDVNRKDQAHFGDEDKNGFSYFVPKNSGGGFGGGGGGVF